MANDTTKYEDQIVAYFDRIVRAIRRVENDAAVQFGLNPLQLRVLQFLATAHRPVTVGFAADELEVTEPTMSDSLRSLASKGLIKKVSDDTDRRIKFLQLTSTGKSIALRFAKITRLPLEKLQPAALPRLSGALHQVVAQLFESERLRHARICMTCRYFAAAEDSDLPQCNLLHKQLEVVDLQSDCPDHAYNR